MVRTSFQNLTVDFKTNNEHMLRLRIIIIIPSVWFYAVHALSLSDIKLYSQYYSNQWSVQINGGKQEADRLAWKHGFINEGKVCTSYCIMMVFWDCIVTRVAVFLELYRGELRTELNIAERQ